MKKHHFYSSYDIWNLEKLKCRSCYDKNSSTKKVPFKKIVNLMFNRQFIKVTPNMSRQVQYTQLKSDC